MNKIENKTRSEKQEQNNNKNKAHTQKIIRRTRQVKGSTGERKTVNY